MLWYKHATPLKFALSFLVSQYYRRWRLCVISWNKCNGLKKSQGYIEKFWWILVLNILFYSLSVDTCWVFISLTFPDAATFAPGHIVRHSVSRKTLQPTRKKKPDDEQKTGSRILLEMSCMILRYFYPCWTFLRVRKSQKRINLLSINEQNISRILPYWSQRRIRQIFGSFFGG